MSARKSVFATIVLFALFTFLLTACGKSLDGRYNGTVTFLQGSMSAQVTATMNLVDSGGQLTGTFMNQASSGGSLSIVTSSASVTGTSNGDNASITSFNDATYCPTGMGTLLLSGADLSGSINCGSYVISFQGMTKQ